nr:PREDICTED: uncharacterized protein LOC108217046 [Daucus carota subsp. sativus]
MPARSTIEAIYLIRCLMEKYRERCKDLHVVFIDLEKAYDSIPRAVLWRCLPARGVPSMYIRTIQDMYSAVETCVRTPVGDTQYFPVKVGLHQAESLYEVNVKLEQWRASLEGYGLRLSRSKTEYFCTISEEIHEEGVSVCIAESRVPQVNTFKYLGSIIQSNGNISTDVTHRISIGWFRWRAATGVLCDKSVPYKLKGKFYRVAIRPSLLYGSECWPLRKAQERRLETAEKRWFRWRAATGVLCDKSVPYKLKGKFYRVAIRPSLLYGSECWPLRKAQERRLETAEKRMLRWMCGKTMTDHIPNVTFRRLLGVEAISKKIREGRLRWYGHVRRKSKSATEAATSVTLWAYAEKKVVNLEGPDQKVWPVLYHNKLGIKALTGGWEI